MTAIGQGVVLGAGEGRHVGVALDTLTFKGAGEEDRYSVVEYEAAAGMPGPPLHVHHKQERRDHPDQHHSCRPADRRGPGDGRGHRGGVAARRGAPGGLGGLRAVAGRCRPGRRRPWRRGERRRGRAGARVAWSGLRVILIRLTHDGNLTIG